MYLTDLYCHRRLVSAKLHYLIFVRHKKVVWELSEHYIICRAIHRSTASSHYFHYPFTAGKNNKIFNYYSPKVVHKRRTFHSLSFNKHIFQLCLGWWHHKGIFSCILFIYCCFGFWFLFYIPQKYLSRNLSDSFQSFLFFHQKIEGCDLWAKHRYTK